MGKTLRGDGTRATRTQAWVERAKTLLWEQGADALLALCAYHASGRPIRQLVRPAA